MNKTQSGKYIIKESDTIERLSIDPKEVFNKLWIYPSKGVTTGGLLLANDASVFLGERTEGDRDVTPDALAETDGPVKIELPQGTQKALRDVLIQGTAGDGVWFKFWKP